MANETYNSNYQNKIKPIRILVSYEWEKEVSEKGTLLKPVREHRRWKNISRRLKSIADAVNTFGKKYPGTNKIDIRIDRLRGLHGAALLPTLIERIKLADILVMDIGSDRGDAHANSNVLIELGMALAIDGDQKRGIFVLKPDTCDWPSDLNGFLYTEYKNTPSDKNKLELLDYHGFDAAVRSVLLDLARTRDMLGSPNVSIVEVQDEDIPKL